METVHWLFTVVVLPYKLIFTFAELHYKFTLNIIQLVGLLSPAEIIPSLFLVYVVFVSFSVAISTRTQTLYYRSRGLACRSASFYAQVSSNKLTL